MLAFPIAFSYLRRRMTAYLAVAAVILAVVVLTVVVAVMDGFQSQIRRNIRGTLGHVEVDNIDWKPGLLREIEDLGVREIKALSPRLIGYVLVDRGGTRQRALDFGIVVGIDPEAESRTTPLRSFVVDLSQRMTAISPEQEAAIARSAAFARGECDSPFPTHGIGKESRHPGVLIGRIMATRLGLRPGDVVRLSTVPYALTPKGEDPEVVPEQESGLKPKERKFVIAGYYDTSEYEFAGLHIFMDLPDAMDFLEATEPSQIVVCLDDFVHASRVREILDDHFAEDPHYIVQAQTWEDRRRNLLDAIRVERALMVILLFCVFIVAGFMIGAILSGMVREKIRDIGVLMAIGTTRTSVLAIFLWCGAIIGTIGSVLGTLGGRLLALNLNAINGWIYGAFGWEIFPRGVYGFERIPVELDPQWTLIIALLAFGCSLFSAVLPALLACFLRPVEALRHE